LNRSVVVPARQDGAILASAQRARKGGAIKRGSQAARPERPRKKIVFQTADIQMAVIVFVKFVEFVANNKK